jgi:hypothetical protein
MTIIYHNITAEKLYKKFISRVLVEHQHFIGFFLFFPSFLF